MPIVEYTAWGSETMGMAMLGFAFGSIFLMIYIVLVWVFRELKGAISITLLLFGLTLILGPQISINQAKKTPYAIVSQGQYDHVGYTGGGFGSMASTIIYFSDGKTYVLLGRHNMDFSKGTVLKISENKLYVKVEEAK